MYETFGLLKKKEEMQWIFKSRQSKQNASVNVSGTVNLLPIPQTVYRWGEFRVQPFGSQERT